METLSFKTVNHQDGSTLNWMCGLRRRQHKVFVNVKETHHVMKLTVEDLTTFGWFSILHWLSDIQQSRNRSDPFWMPNYRWSLYYEAGRETIQTTWQTNHTGTMRKWGMKNKNKFNYFMKSRTLLFLKMYVLYTYNKKQTSVYIDFSWLNTTRCGKSSRCNAMTLLNASPCSFSPFPDVIHGLSSKWDWDEIWTEECHTSFVKLKLEQQVV